MSCDNTDRDQVLAYAHGWATASKSVIVLYKAFKRPEWFAKLYGRVPDDADNSTVRYILPNGEVTRLS